VERYSRYRQATDANIVRRMEFACWVTKATDTHSEYVIIIVFSSAGMVRRTRICVMFLHKIPVLLSYIPMYYSATGDNIHGYRKTMNLKSGFIFFLN